MPAMSDIVFLVLGWQLYRLELPVLVCWLPSPSIRWSSSTLIHIFQAKSITTAWEDRV
jgi:hypothetical protein